MSALHTAWGVARHAWSPDDSWLAVVGERDEQVRCIDAESGDEVFEWDPPRFWRGVFIAAVSPEALLVVTRARDDVRVFVLAVPDGGVVAEARLDLAPGDITVEVSADGATAALLSGPGDDGVAHSQPDGEVARDGVVDRALRVGRAPLVGGRAGLSGQRSFAAAPMALRTKRSSRVSRRGVTACTRALCATASASTSPTRSSPSTLSSTLS